MAQRGRKPKPTHLKVVTGNAHQHKLNDREPEVAGPLGGPPAGWTEDQRVIWSEVVDCAPAGVLTKSDRHLIEIAVRLLAQIRSSPDVVSATVTQFRACLSEMGMTPSARSRLFTGGHGNPKNPFADLD